MADAMSSAKKRRCARLYFCSSRAAAAPVRCLTRVWHRGEGGRLEALERAFGGSVLSDVLSTTAAPAEPAAAAAPARGKHSKAAAKPPAAGAADTRARRSEVAWSSRGTCGTRVNMYSIAEPRPLPPGRELRPPRVWSGRLSERLSVPHAVFCYHVATAGSSAAIFVALRKHDVSSPEGHAAHLWPHAQASCQPASTGPIHGTGVRRTASAASRGSALAWTLVSRTGAEGTTATTASAAAAGGDAGCYTALETRVRSGALATALHLGEPLGRAPADWVDDMLARLMRANAKVGDARVQIASRLGVRVPFIPPILLLPWLCLLTCDVSFALPMGSGVRASFVMTGQRSVACTGWCVCVWSLCRKRRVPSC